MSTRSFLLLQGGATPFFRQLGRMLTAAGHSVQRINFCAGDALFWGRRDAIDFADAVDRLPAFMDEQIVKYAVTDIAAFGDCRPCHRTGFAAARTHGLRVHVFEEGYLRPGWITLERDGVNGYSSLPKDARYYRDTALHLSPIAAPFAVTESTLLRTLWDIAYHFSNFLFSGRYPGYRNHRQDSASMEYWGWTGRLSSWPFRYPRYRAAMRRINVQRLAYFLFPLQLSGDTQIQFHSPFKSMSEGIDQVLDSFARHAPQGASLLVKLHPLDTGLVSYGSYVAKLASRLGISRRVLFVDGGDLSRMIRHSLGVVTVNSTVGMAALRAGRPLYVIGEAVYDVPGLAFQGPLELFWKSPEAPDMALMEDFLKVLIHQTQVRGNYYSRKGIDAAVSGSLGRLTA